MTRQDEVSPLFRTPWNHDSKVVSDVCVVRNVEPSLTVQSQAEDADINVLMRRMGVTGQMPSNPRVPIYGDFTGVGDYRSALDAVRTANEGFAQLPAQSRAFFQNDPQNLLLFAADPANKEKLRELGLLKEVSHVGVTGGADPAPGGGGKAADPAASKAAGGA